MTIVATPMFESRHLRSSVDHSACMATARKGQTAQNDMSMSALTSATQDISSDEEGMGSDDVDSDGLEEFFGDEEGEIDEDIPTQQDFVSMR
ncbi:hypothetical protein ACEPPN_003225 [Leptodophora sp. 'Broadleaf-Isolate-01']